MAVHGLSFTPRSDNSLSYSDSYATPTLYSLLYILCSIVYSILGNVLYSVRIYANYAWDSVGLANSSQSQPQEAIS